MRKDLRLIVVFFEKMSSRPLSATELVQLFDQYVYIAADFDSVTKGQARTALISSPPHLNCHIDQPCNSCGGTNRLYITPWCIVNANGNHLERQQRYHAPVTSRSVANFSLCLLSELLFAAKF